MYGLSKLFKWTSLCLGILARHAEKVQNDELRTYMNEMVIFGLEQAMKDHNPTVKGYKAK